MLDILLLLIAGMMLLAGTITDLRWREVPDWLSYAGIVAGIGIRAMWSVDDGSWFPIIEGLVGMGVFFTFSAIMYYLGQWGGGDTKILIAMGVLLGIPAVQGMEDKSFWLLLLAVTVVLVVRTLWITVLFLLDRTRGIRHINSFAIYLGLVSKTLGKLYDVLLLLTLCTAGLGFIGLIMFTNWWVAITGIVPWVFIFGWVLSSDFFIPRVSLHQLIVRDYPVEDIVVGSHTIWKCGGQPLSEHDLAKVRGIKTDHVQIERGNVTICIFIFACVSILVAVNMFLGYMPALDSEGVGFFMNSSIMGGLYGVTWISALTIWHWKKVRVDVKHRIAQTDFIKVRNICLFVTGVFILVGLVLPMWLQWSVLAIGLLIVPFCYLFALVKSVEVCCMHKALSPNQLTEGDWVVKDVYVDGKRICGTKDLGLDLTQIKHIQELHAKHKIQTVLVKEGIPFVPGFLLGFGMMLMVGNLVLEAAVWWVSL